MKRIPWVFVSKWHADDKRTISPALIGTHSLWIQPVLPKLVNGTHSLFEDTACPTKVGQLKTPRIFGCLRLPCAQTLGMRDFQITCRSQTHNFSCSNLNTQFVKYSISYQTWGMKHHSLMKIITNCPDWNHIKWASSRFQRIHYLSFQWLMLD